VVKIVFSPLAKLDLKEIIDFIKRDSLHYAILESKKIQAAINGLMKHSLMGRVVPEIENNQYRELIFRNYRIIYRIVSEEQINILTIHHHSRSFANNPAFKSED
jgi:toxin ParE1/3/4